VRKLSSPPPPVPQEVETKLLDLIEGRCTREEAEDWALQWVAADDPEVEHDGVWEALMALAGAGLKTGPSAYLHGEADFSAWLDELRGSTQA
jgi:hypothetical protein